MQSETPRPLSSRMVQHEQQRDSVELFSQSHHLYALNLVDENLWDVMERNTEGPFAVPASLLARLDTQKDDPNAVLTASRIRRMARPENAGTLEAVLRDYNVVIWRNSGWHLSQMWTPEKMAMEREQAFEEAFRSFWTVDRCVEVQVPPLQVSQIGHMMQQNYVSVNSLYL